MPTTKEFKSLVNNWAKIYMHRSMQDFKGFMKETGLSFSHVIILMRLYHGGMSGVSDIGEQLGVTNAAASQTVDRLVGLGLIRRTEDPQDRRAKCLELTPKGRSTVESGINARSLWLEKLAEQLSPDQQDNISSVLILLTEAARRTAE